MATAGKIRSTQNKLLESAQSPFYVDDDYYWQGSFYNNPNDSRPMVEKRIGYGYTINVATTKGKIVKYSILLGIPVFLLALFLMLFRLDTGKFEMIITGNQVSIHAPMYGYEFPLSDIKSVTTINTLPSGYRTNGAATGKYNLGNFSLSGYGASKMYVYKEHPPYIVLELPNLYIFFNSKDSEQTRGLYELLRERAPANP